MTSTVLVIGALPESLLNFRGDLLRSLKASGYRVIALAAPSDGMSERLQREIGVEFESYPVSRTGLNPFNDLKTLVALVKIYWRYKPAAVLAYTIKPVIYGGLATYAFRSTRFVGLITGLGFTFAGNGMLRSLLRTCVSRLYSLALRNSTKVIFQNRDDMQEFVNRQIIQPERCALVGGSGVNLERFPFSPLSNGAPKFLLIARLLRAKGILEYVEAARKIKAEFPGVSFQLVGPEDPSPDGIPLPLVMQWNAEGYIDYLGEAADVRPYLEACHIYVLPSYREGMPRTVLEAMSTGRPILTTNAPGCRETVRQGENGFTVAVANVHELTARIRWFLLNREQWPAMGVRSRELANTMFEVGRVNEIIVRLLIPPRES